MLRADWAFFLELTSYALHGLSPGSVAFGIEEVSEAVAQKAVAVLFVPVGCGHGGEGAVRRVAAAGGRGYIVGLAHELHEDVSAWGAAAVLRQPLKRRLTAEQESAAEPEQKRQRLDESAKEVVFGAVAKSSVFARRPDAAAAEASDTRAALSAATPKAAMMQPPPPPADQQWPDSAVSPEPRPFLQQELHDPLGGLDAPGDWASAQAPAAEPAPASPPKPLRPEDHERDLRRAIKSLGKIENLYDKTAIPAFGEALRDRYLPELGAVAVFSALGDTFVAAKGVAHRKAMVYGAHELIMRKRGRALAVDDRRACCLRHFFMRIGKCIRGFKADERHAYIRLVGAWQSAKSFPAVELAELKEAWDVD